MEISMSTGTLVGCVVWLTMKERISQADDEAALQLSTTDGTIEIVDGSHVRLKFKSKATKFLCHPSYFVDVQIKTPDGEICTVEDLADVIKVRDEVTRSG